MTIRQTENLWYRELFEYAPDAVFVADRATGMLIDVNRKAEKLTGYTREELLRMHQTDLHPKDRLKDAEHLFEEGHRVTDFGTFDFVIQHKDGHIIDVEICPSLMTLESNQKVVRGTFHDITRRKQAEESLRESLAEKEALLREVHHRVKNNLQIITSLLSLQATRVPEGAARRALTHSHARVQAMALVHETIHDSATLRQISLRAYMRRLLEYLQTSFGQRGREIAIDFDLVEVSVLPDEAMPLGLAINELLTNAMQHAFPEGKEGTIRVGMVTDENTIEVSVSDNGVGYSSEADAGRSKSLGLSLVRGLIERQLHGTFDITSENGTQATIRIPRQELEAFEGKTHG